MLDIKLLELNNETQIFDHRFDSYALSFGFKQSESQNAEVVDTEVQNSELQTQVPQTGKTPSSVASPSNSGTWCSKTSGWSIEDLSPSGKWQYEMLSKYKTGL